MLKVSRGYMQDIGVDYSNMSDSIYDNDRKSIYLIHTISNSCIYIYVIITETLSDINA